MKAEGEGDGTLFQYHMRWGQTGLWIDETSAHGPVDVSLVACGAARSNALKIGERPESAAGKEPMSESAQFKSLEGFADADYCLEDSVGYIWNLNKIAQDSKGIYLTGTCNTGSGVMDVIATYTWARSGLAMTAFDGSIPNLTCSFRWGQTGQWINASSSTGTVDIGFCIVGQ